MRGVNSRYTEDRSLRIDIIGSVSIQLGYYKRVDLVYRQLDLKDTYNPLHLTWSKNKTFYCSAFLSYTIIIRTSVPLLLSFVGVIGLHLEGNRDDECPGTGVCAHLIIPQRLHATNGTAIPQREKEVESLRV